MADCIFCKIAAGEVPSQKVYEDDSVIAFKDLSRFDCPEETYSKRRALSSGR